MKKIGIITYHRAINYGAVLQCYALSQTLKKLGYNAFVIDYDSMVMKKNRQLFNFEDIVSFLFSLKMLSSKLHAIHNFDSFIKKHIPTTDCNALLSGENHWDAIIVGSDQVWSPRINNGFDDIYWGNFRKDLKKITYAASMGTDHKLSATDKKAVIIGVENFEKISVRENSLLNELKSIGVSKEIVKVLDPTLLLSSNDYDIIIEKDCKYKNYIFYYEIRYDKCTLSFLYRLAKQLNCKIVSLLGPKAHFNDVEYIRLSHGDVTVELFLSLIKNAKCVVTSSFHGTAFSIIYKKDFYSFVHKDCDRARDLLDSIGLRDRMVSPQDTIDFLSTNYSQAEKLLSNQVVCSTNYLLTSIN